MRRAMIDVSDGLLADLGHVADASGVGFRLDRVPVSPGATIEEALGGGEDYELVVATSPIPRPWWPPSPRPGCGRRSSSARARADPTERTLAGEPTTALGMAALLGMNGQLVGLASGVGFGTWRYHRSDERTRGIADG